MDFMAAHCIRNMDGEGELMAAIHRQQRATSEPRMFTFFIFAIDDESGAIN
jgi:hypothetical protein